MANFLGSYASIIPKLLDQAAITFNDKEYKHVCGGELGYLET